jgi:hypothetical protein
MGVSSMSYEEKGAWLYLMVTIVTYVGYVIVILGRADGVPLADVTYVSTMLWAIGIAIASSIFGRIVIAAVEGDDPPMDVRDKDIYRFGEYVGGVVIGFGMIVPFGLTLAEAQHFWIANAMYAVFVLSALVSTPVKLVAYRRGF